MAGVSLSRLQAFATPELSQQLDTVESAIKKRLAQLVAATARLQEHIGKVEGYTGADGVTGRVLETAGNLVHDLQPGDLEALPQAHRTLQQIQGLIGGINAEAYGLSQLQGLLWARTGGTTDRFTDVRNALTYVSTAKNASVVAPAIREAVTELATTLVDAFVTDPFAFEAPGNKVRSVAFAARDALALADALGDAGFKVAIAFWGHMLKRPDALLALKNTQQVGEMTKIGSLMLERCLAPTLKEDAARAWEAAGFPKAT